MPRPGYEQLTAFVANPATAARVQRVNQAIRDGAILTVFGDSGTGKDRFFDWWWQGGCQDPRYAGQEIVYPDEVVLVQVHPGLGGSLGVASVVFSKVWLALKEIERARAQQEQPSRLPPLAAGKGERELLRLIFQDVHAVADTLQPAAYVFTDAHHLNKQTLRLILEELHSPQRFGRPRIVQSAIVLCGRPENNYRSLLGACPQTRAVLGHAETFRSLQQDQAAFVHVMVEMIRQNLDAVFGPDVDRKACIVDFHTWTQGNWWRIDKLVQVLDRGLGSRRADGTPRILTNAVLTYVRKTWLERQRDVLPPQADGDAP